MRYEGCLLTEAESRLLIDDIDSWCRRTNTNYNKIVIAAGVAVTIRHKVRVKGQRVTFAVANKLRKAMEDNPNGIGKVEHKARLAGMSTVPVHLTSIQIEARRLNREPCSWCGTRADIGCKHSVAWPVTVIPRWAIG